VIGARATWPSGRGERAVLVALLVLLAAGIALRVCFALAKGPAFIGFGDSTEYIVNAQGGAFDVGTHPAGYPVVLWLMHALDANLSFAILVQHALGVCTALLWFLTVRRVAPAGWGLIPAAVVLLAGSQAFLEHTALSEGPFAFLLAALCYCAVRALDDGPAPWAYLAGALAAVAACLRSVATALIVVLLVWLLAAVPARRWAVVGAATLSIWLIVAGYVVATKQDDGYVGLGLVHQGGLSLYASVAPYADCHRFTPPAGTRDLCDPRPAARRPGPIWYVNDGASPARKRLADGAKPADDAAFTAFARAAVLHQPLDYLERVGTDLTRFWSSDLHYTPDDGDNYAVLIHLLVRSAWLGSDRHLAWYATAAPRQRDGLLDALRGYERHTRLEGPAFALLTLLALVGVPAARGRRLKVGLLLLAVTAVALLAPILTTVFSTRYVVPGYGALAATAAIGAAALWDRAVAWRTSRREGERARQPATA
jgi:hypothetical protein